MRLVAPTGVISIHGNGGILDSLWKIIDVDEEEKGGKDMSLVEHQLLCPQFLNPHH